MTAMREEPLKDKALEGRLKDYLTTQEKSQQTKGALRPDKALQQLKIFKSHYLKFKEERDNVGKAKEALKLKVARRQHCANHKHVKKLITSFQKGNKLIDNKLVEAKAAGYRGAEMGKHRTQLEEQLWANLQRTPSQGGQYRPGEDAPPCGHPGPQAGLQGRHRHQGHRQDRHQVVRQGQEDFLWHDQGSCHAEGSQAQY